MNPWITAADLFTLVAGFVLLLPRGETSPENTQRLDLITAPPETLEERHAGQQHWRLAIRADGVVLLNNQTYPTISEALHVIEGGVVVLAVDRAAPFELPGQALTELAGKARVTLATLSAKSDTDRSHSAD
jgi:hypothetical protein